MVICHNWNCNYSVIISILDYQIDILRFTVNYVKRKKKTSRKWIHTKQINTNLWQLEVRNILQPQINKGVRNKILSIKNRIYFLFLQINFVNYSFCTLLGLRRNTYTLICCLVSSAKIRWLLCLSRSVIFRCPAWRWSYSGSSKRNPN